MKKIGQNKNNLKKEKKIEDILFKSPYDIKTESDTDRKETKDQFIVDWQMLH